MKSFAFEICVERALIYRRLMKEKHSMERKLLMDNAQLLDQENQENVVSLTQARCEILKMFSDMEGHHEQRAA